MLGYLSRQGSPWVSPLLYGLCASALILLCIVLLRFLFRATPSNIESRIRGWLDRISVAVKKVELPDFIFNYHITLNGKVFIIAQPRSHPEYIDFHTDISFTPDDNKAIELTPGGVPAVVRLMRVCLALKDIGHSGVVGPLKKIILSKRLLITSELNENQFTETLYRVEAALNLVLALTAQEMNLVMPNPPVKP
jgi:hypothetical protein